MTGLEVLIPAAIPVISDGVRALVNKFTGGAGAAPANVEEAIQLMDAETRKAQALAALDQPQGNVSPWVADCRAMMRPVIGSAIVTASFIWQDAALSEMAASVVFYLFADRGYSKLKGAD